MPRRSRARGTTSQPAAETSTAEMPIAANSAASASENKVETSAATLAAETLIAPTAADLSAEIDTAEVPVSEMPVSEMPVSEMPVSEMPVSESPVEVSPATVAVEPFIAENPATTSTEPVAAEPAAVKRAPKRTPKRAPKSDAISAVETAAPTTVAIPAPPAAPPKPQIAVTIRPWSGGDLPLLGRLMGDPAMTVYLGGPETAKELRERHVRYCNIEPNGGMMYVILAGDNQKPAGSVGYWEHEWQGQVVWETGWSVLPEFQGMGIAAHATRLVVDAARANGKHRTIHAYPSVENAASNGVCRKAGFTLLGAVDFDYRRAPGGVLRCNDWCIDLFAR